MRWCQGVPQACTPWRADVAGAPSRSWGRAVGQRTPEGWRSLSFLRPPLGRSPRAPVVAMCPPCLGGLGAVWGAVPRSLAQALGRPQAPLAACPWRVVPPTAGRPPTLGRRRWMSWTLRLPPGGGPSENGGDVRPFGAGPLGPASGIAGRWCPLGAGVVRTPVVPVHTPMEDDSPCRGRRRAAAATGSARVPAPPASFRCAVLHPRSVRTARAPPRGERP